MPINDWEIWVCAARMMETHGENASVQAAMNADLLLKKGDLDGQRAWVAILRRIKELEDLSHLGLVH